MSWKIGCVVLLLLGLTGGCRRAKASQTGRRNTAVGVTALSIYELARGHTTTGILAGAGAYYAWHRYQQGHQRHTRRHAYLAGYQAGASQGYWTEHPRRFNQGRHLGWGRGRRVGRRW
jgi:hypothetical protein